MSNELTVTGIVRFDNGSISVDFGKASIKLDVSGDKYVHRIQEIGTSEEAIGLGDLGTPGYAIFFNRDSTNFVEIRPATGVADLVKLKAGEIAVFRITSDATPYAIADTAAVDLEYLIIED